MRLHRIAIAVLVLATVVALGVHARLKPTQLQRPPQRMERIELEQTCSAFPCASYTVTLERDGRATVRGERMTFDERTNTSLHAPIEWRTQVPASSMRALIAAVESPDYARLEPKYFRMITHQAGRTLTVTGSGMVRSTDVYGVPCQHGPNASSYPLLPDDPVVPDVFCAVFDLIEVASCARYWAPWASPQARIKLAVPMPPRCKPIT